MSDTQVMLDELTRLVRLQGEIINSQRNMLVECLDRARRVETRVTKFMQAQGFEANTCKPEIKNGVLHIPSLDASLRSCMAAVPTDADDVDIHLKNELVGYIGVFRTYGNH